MKTLILFLSALALLTVSCDDTKKESQNNQNNQNPLPFTVLKSDAPRAEPQSDAAAVVAYVEENSRFALDLFHELRAGNDNIFFSPHSLNVALMMTYAGARENTAAQMAQVLGFDPEDELIHDKLNALDLHLAGLGADDPEAFRLSVVNAAWGQENYTFLDGYLDVLAMQYGAGMYLLDFFADPEGSREIINDWVEQMTENRIEDLLPENSITPDTRLVLTNAIYFKADWEFPFEKDMTHPASFARLNGSTVSVEMMARDKCDVYYRENDDFQMVELPYKGEDTAMVILLPKEGRFEDVQDGLDAEFLFEQVALMENQTVIVSVPKFSFDFDASMKTPLMELGMVDAFTPFGADFSGMNGDTSLFIMDVVHKAFVAVDEKGTEAAAASGVIIGDTSAPMYSITVNRPFFFFIRDRVYGTILFFGRVMDPTL